jgi:hypothetical protein
MLDPKSLSQPKKTFEELKIPSNNGFTSPQNIDQRGGILYPTIVEHSPKETRNPYRTNRDPLIEEPRQEKRPEEIRPSRFAHCLGFEDQDMPENPNRRHLDDASGITEEVDIYEKIRNQPAGPNDYPERNGPIFSNEDLGFPRGLAGNPTPQERRSDGAPSKTILKAEQGQGPQELSPAEDNMISMMHQQARIIEQNLEKKSQPDA